MGHPRRFIFSFDPMTSTSGLLRSYEVKWVLFPLTFAGIETERWKWSQCVSIAKIHRLTCNRRIWLHTWPHVVLTWGQILTLTFEVLLNRLCEVATLKGSERNIGGGGRTQDWGNSGPTQKHINWRPYMVAVCVLHIYLVRIPPIEYIGCTVAFNPNPSAVKNKCALCIFARRLFAKQVFIRLLSLDVIYSSRPYPVSRSVEHLAGCVMCIV